MPNWNQELLNTLARGGFPLLNDGGIAQWVNLVDMFDADANQSLLDVKAAMTRARRFAFSDIYHDEIEVNGVDINTGQSDLDCFLGAVHERLTADHALATRDNIQRLIQRVRVLMRSSVEESQIVLGLDTHLKMGNGLRAIHLTCVPDPAWHVTFGSVPDQEVIGRLAPHWNTLKRRNYESQTGSLGAKPHYVLAHLLNHNVNGPGNNPLNAVPFWAAANTKMASQAEKHVKTLVNRGCAVQYMIQCGSPVGMTPGRQAALDACTTPLQRAIIEAEQYLPSSLIITIKFIDPTTGAHQDILNAHPIANYVPETVPTVR